MKSVSKGFKLNEKLEIIILQNYIYWAYETWMFHSLPTDRTPRNCQFTSIKPLFNVSGKLATRNLVLQEI